jgi:glutaredoxin-related protein
MSRAILDEAHIHPAVRERVARLHRDVVDEVRAAVAAHPVVVVGMGWNPFVRKACRMLGAAGIEYRYFEFGNYLNQWRLRNALKMWTGWPTFPMVFIKGALIGGAEDLARLKDGGELAAMLA